MLHINDLPNEVLEIIVTHCHSDYAPQKPKSRLHEVAKTCRRWFDVTFISYKERFPWLADQDDICGDCYAYYLLEWDVNLRSELPSEAWKRLGCRCAKIGSKSVARK